MNKRTNESTHGQVSVWTAVLRPHKYNFPKQASKDCEKDSEIHLILTFWCHLCSTTRYHWDAFYSIFDFRFQQSLSIYDIWLKTSDSNLIFRQNDDLTLVKLWKRIKSYFWNMTSVRKLFWTGNIPLMDTNRRIYSHFIEEKSLIKGDWHLMPTRW